MNTILLCVKIVFMDLRAVFMGSPDFALPVLKVLAENVRVVGVITQPDRPAGRGKVLTPPPVKLLAEQLGMEIIQPNRLKEPETLEKLFAWKPDLIVVAAFGQILRQNVLDLPRLGCINVHASLLPRWRGAAPIQAAILAGDSHSGVTIMKMDAGIDTGAILGQATTPITDEDTAGTLSARLAVLGAQLLIDTLPGYVSGSVLAVTQNNELATYASMLKKEDGELKFDQSAAKLERLVRAFQPWPSTYFFVHNEMVKVLEACVTENYDLKAGQRGVWSGLPIIGTHDGALVLQVVQPAGKKPMTGDVFLRGARNWFSEG